MVPSKLKRHLHIKHPHLSEKPTENIKQARLNNGPKSQLFLTKFMKQAMPLLKPRQKRLNHIELLGQ
jgi:hypothetical protein